jgi:hypothetical protein
MKKLLFIPGLLVLTLFILLRAPAQEEKPLRLAQTIALPAVEGRIDHLAVDVQSQRLFLAALGNNTLEVIDLKAGKVIHSVKGLREPQGVAFVPEANAVYVANGGDGNCEAFGADSLAPLLRSRPCAAPNFQATPTTCVTTPAPSCFLWVTAAGPSGSLRL